MKREKQKKGIQIVKQLLKERRFYQANDLIVRMMKPRQYITYSIFSFKQIILIFKNKDIPDKELYVKELYVALNNANACFKNNNKKNQIVAINHINKYPHYYETFYESAIVAINTVAAGKVIGAAEEVSQIAIQISDSAQQMSFKLINYGIKLLRKNNKIKS